MSLINIFFSSLSIKIPKLPKMLKHLFYIRKRCYSGKNCFKMVFTHQRNVKLGLAKSPHSNWLIQFNEDLHKWLRNWPHKWGALMISLLIPLLTLLSVTFPWRLRFKTSMQRCHTLWMKKQTNSNASLLSTILLTWYQAPRGHRYFNASSIVLNNKRIFTLYEEVDRHANSRRASTITGQVKTISTDGNDLHLTGLALSNPLQSLKQYRMFFFQHDNACDILSHNKFYQRLFQNQYKSHPHLNGSLVILVPRYGVAQNKAVPSGREVVLYVRKQIII